MHLSEGFVIFTRLRFDDELSAEDVAQFGTVSITTTLQHKQLNNVSNILNNPNMSNSTQQHKPN